MRSSPRDRTARSLAAAALAAAAALMARAQEAPAANDPFAPVNPPYGLLEMMEVSAETGGLGEDEASEVFLYEEEASSWARELRASRIRFDEIGRDAVEDLGVLGVPPLDGAGYTPPARLARTRLFNGFNPGRVPQAPFPTRGETIGAALATYFGRTGPGGLANQLTLPAGRREQTLLRAGGSTDPSFSTAAQRTGMTSKKGASYRVDLNGSWKEGPEDYARSAGGTAMVALRKESKKGFVQLNVGIDSSEDNPAEGVVAGRPSARAKVTGPYLPLAGFNPQGPHAWRTGSKAGFNFSAERRTDADWTLRMNTLAGRDRAEEYRFRNGQYLIDKGIFSGTREPQHTEINRWGVSQGAEAVHRFEGFGLPQRFVLGLEGTHSRGSTDQHLLPQALVAGLPEGMRHLDPDNPDFSPLPYGLGDFTRVSTRQRDRTFTGGAYAHDRIGLDHGRHYLSFGARWDWQNVEVRDLRPNARVPLAETERSAPGGHVSWLTQIVPGRVSVFATWSRAFLPSTLVDSRRGQVVGSETTQGFEGGCFARSEDGTWQGTVNAHLLERDDITRANPLFNDPVADADRTQPQYLAAGTEQFLGGEAAVSWRNTRGWRAGTRFTLSRALVTASPDLASEVDRQMAGVPRWNASASAGRSITLGNNLGLDLSLSGTWTPDYVVRREDRLWQQLDAEGFFSSSFSASLRWQSSKTRHTLTASVRNLPDTDLLGRTYRYGQGRELFASYSVVF